MVALTETLVANTEAIPRNSRGSYDHRAWAEMPQQSELGGRECNRPARLVDLEIVPAGSWL
ncbi:hypothetical protein G6027_11230 [Dietzia sp. SLG310A2-38A2]|uniref:hypothetical protein n=1 Tax=Dietzia sp. SLG310A2-38A2 TaxID=1630643 RepID=UPI0015FA9484|nr:hypothetical protein [Dietzia sp. SLG310A2-38A2]MBB1031449.1 hypothetical protein [Dietzia sp. SLG310A2-38A2]